MHPAVTTCSGEVPGCVSEHVYDERELNARVNQILNCHAAIDMAAGVVRDGRLAFFRGHGPADIAAREAPMPGERVKEVQHA
jgi:hypothetical protein